MDISNNPITHNNRIKYSCIALGTWPLKILQKYFFSMKEKYEKKGEKKREKTYSYRDKEM